MSRLGDDCLKALADRFRTVHPDKKPALAELRAAFDKVGCKPASLKEVVKTMAAHGITDSGRGFGLYLASDAQVANWIGVLGSITSFDRAC